MTQLLVELPEEMETQDFEGDPTRSTAAIFMGASEWRALIWSAYDELKLPVKVIAFTFVHPVDISAKLRQPETAISLRLTTDIRLFNQVMAVFLQYGCDGITAIRRAVASANDIELKVSSLFDRTCLLVERLIAEQLQEIEYDATLIAKEEVRSNLEGVAERIAKFTPTYIDRHYQELHVAGLDDLHTHLQDSRRRITAFQEVGKLISERNAKDGSDERPREKRRKAEPYRETWIKVLKQWQSVEFTALLELQYKIHAIFPPALLILDDLGLDVDNILPLQQRAKASKSVREKSRLAELKYHSRIYNVLLKLQKDYKVVAANLLLPGIDALMSAYLAGGPDRGHAGLFVALTDLLLAEPPTASSFSAAAAKGAADEFGYGGPSEVGRLTELARVQAITRCVMARVPLLKRLKERYLETSPGSFRRVVLLQYTLHLEQILDGMAKQAAESAALWRHMQFVSSLGSLVVIAVTLPFGSELALPGALAALGAAISIGLFTLAIAISIRDVFNLLNANAQAAPKLRGKLLDLGQQNPDGLIELGSLLSANRKLADAASEGLIVTLIEIAISSRLRPIAVALEFRGYLDDIEVLQESLVGGSNGAQ